MGTPWVQNTWDACIRTKAAVHVSPCRAVPHDFFYSAFLFNYTRLSTFLFVRTIRPLAMLRGTFFATMVL